MSFSDLDSHTVIAWDMDRTLIGGPKSLEWRQYLLGRRDAVHHVITFRTGPSKIPGREHLQTWVDDVSDQLEAHGVPRDRIAGVHGIPPHIFAAYGMDPRYRADDVHHPEVQKFLSEQLELREWKGKKAHELGATVLIDDMPDMVLLGCLRYGVRFVNSVE